MAFPGLDGVEVCVLGDASTGDPVAIEYKIPGVNGGEREASGRGRVAGGLSGNAKRLFESIGAFLHGGGTPDASTLSEPSLAKYLSTPFARKVVEALRSTKAGETTTYAELAAKAGAPGAARAVGNVMRRNPFPIVIPCHRVVSRSGLGGYSGDVHGTSLLIKQALLDIEAARK
ncbi:MAG: methylated-DNA--[protein]-cysteine S-methyltransferase [Candidatus Lokiarchaeota archaeon]|nr:methylated-DNA--[protein]-cysteine S-methyltransferase [Candidatus Lokiarchaeota archaeon]